MNYRRLGKSGLKVSELSFGAWVTFGTQHSDTTAGDCLKAAYDAGVNFFDNAEAYAAGEAESQMGRAIKSQGWSRESLVISTKIFFGGKGPNQRGLSHKHMVEGVNAALKRLQTDYVDLMFCHRPDEETPIEETVRAIDVLIKQGKIFYWGTSEWSAAEIAKADGIARQYGLTPPTMEQPQYSMLERDRVEDEYTPLYRDLGLGTTTWSPLASGILSGKYSDGIPPGSRLDLPGYEWLKAKLTPEVVEKVKGVAAVAKDLGCSPAQLALAWCLKNPNVSTVITGASQVSQVHENLKAADFVSKLTPEVMKKLEGVLKNNPNGDDED